MTVTINAEVLDSVARKLATVNTSLPGMLAEARDLDVSWAVAGLSEVPAWSEDTIVDLRARIGLVRMIENQSITGLRRPGEFSWLEVAGARTRVSTSLTNINTVLALTVQPAATQWTRHHDESLDDWIVRLKGMALDQLPLVDGHGQLIAEAVDWWGGYVDMLKAGGWTTAAALTIGKTEAAKALLPTVQQMRQAGWITSDAVTRFENRYALYKAPGTTLQGLLMKVIPFEKFNRVPPVVSEQVAKLALRSGLPALESALPVGGQNAMRFVFGSEWTDLRTVGKPGIDVLKLPRGASNLWTVGKVAPWGEKIAAVSKTSGLLRGAGIAGGAASTAYDIANVYSQGNPVEAFKKDKAGYVADVSKTFFDGSLTAAMIAPSPVTWGAVAVTGAVYAGAELVDHWDDVTHATAAAGDWLGDKTDDVGDTLAGGAKAVVDSKVNPMNWF